MGSLEHTFVDVYLSGGVSAQPINTPFLYNQVLPTPFSGNLLIPVET